MKRKYIGKGDVAAQKKRRKERRKLLPERTADKYQLIDNNFTYYPIAYCKAKKGWLSLGLMHTHKCKDKSCIHLVERRTKEQQRMNSQCKYFTLTEKDPKCDIRMDMTFCSKDCAFAEITTVNDAK